MLTTLTLAAIHAPQTLASRYAPTPEMILSAQIVGLGLLAACFAAITFGVMPYWLLIAPPPPYALLTATPVGASIVGMVLLAPAMWAAAGGRTDRATEIDRTLVQGLGFTLALAPVGSQAQQDFGAGGPVPVILGCASLVVVAVLVLRTLRNLRRALRQPDPCNAPFTDCRIDPWARGITTPPCLTSGHQPPTAPRRSCGCGPINPCPRGAWRPLC
ncbi:hypothetical protein [Sulfitobacter sp. S190]|uniref:hypothetical protein n=1 Tax=Sulfitobacter sp. S190 TaxID=2867022 RepID=UPI0021A92823|nr:hypothetical protein [Sulfitobacter sp. S190]UWR21380.1 hypothetical protein K3756_11755 [Sulfitobacter sp. S190]